MSNFDTQLRESQAQVAEAQSKISEITSRIETAREKMKQGTEAAIDVENATLEDVHAHTEVMNANIAELIMGLDDVTAAFSRDFDEMRSETGWELCRFLLQGPVRRPAAGADEDRKYR